MHYNSNSIDTSQIPQGITGQAISSNTESLRVTGMATNEPVIIDHNLGKIISENKENSEKLPIKYQLAKNAEWKSQKPPMGSTGLTSHKHQSSLQLEGQRSLAARSGQMQLFSNGERDTSSKRGSTMNSNLLRQQKIADQNPSLKGNHLYGDYVGRRQIIEQQREKKNQFMKDIEMGRHSFHGNMQNDDKTQIQMETRGNALGIHMQNSQSHIINQYNKGIEQTDQYNILGRDSQFGQAKGGGARVPILNQQSQRMTQPSPGLDLNIMGDNSQNNYATNSNIITSEQISEAPQSTSNYQTQGEGVPSKFRLDSIGSKDHVNIPSQQRHTETHTSSTKSSQVIRPPQIINNSKINQILQRPTNSGGGLGISGQSVRQSQSIASQVLYQLPGTTGNLQQNMSTQNLRGPRPMGLGGSNKALSQAPNSQQASGYNPTKRDGPNEQEMANRRRNIAALRAKQQGLSEKQPPTVALRTKEPSEITFERIDGGPNPQFMNERAINQRQSYLNLINMGNGQNNDGSPTNRYLSQNGFAHQIVGSQSEHGDNSKNAQVFSDRGPLPQGMMGQSQSIPVDTQPNGSPRQIGRKSMGMGGSEYQRRRFEPLNGNQPLTEKYNNIRMSAAKGEQVYTNGYCQKFNPDGSETNQKGRLNPDGTINQPPKTYDYVFIQMSNEQFELEYGKTKAIIYQKQNQNQEAKNNIQAQKEISQPQQQMTSPRGATSNPFANGAQQSGKFDARSPGPFTKSMAKNGNNPLTIPAPSEHAPNLSGLVSVKAYEKIYTNEVPSVTCNLLPTQLDHLKVLYCEEDNQSQAKLTSDAAEKLEIEKQTQVKLYMDDIVGKLQTKERKYKITTKKKFVEDALGKGSHGRVASVYVIVINREKNYDPVLSHKLGLRLNQGNKRLGTLIGARQRTTSVNGVLGRGPQTNRDEDSSSSEDDRANNQQDDQQKQGLLQNRFKLAGNRRSANPSSVTKPSTANNQYDSDTNVPHQMRQGGDNQSTTTTSSTLPKLRRQNKSDQEGSTDLTSGIKPKRTSASIGRPFRVNEEPKFKWVMPTKIYPEKYGPTRARIIQNVDAHKHHQQHRQNIFFAQYNEFVRLLFKNQKASQKTEKFNVNHAIGLAKCLGLRTNKDTFSEQNLKSREHLGQLKERLALQMNKMIASDNKEIFPTPPQGANQKGGFDSEQSLMGSDGGDEAGTLNIKQDKSDSVQKGPSSKAHQIEQQPGGAVQGKGDGLSLYKYHIGVGNNSIMVRSLFKNRYWWLQYEKNEMDAVNFMWTQIKNVNHMETLLCKYPDQKSGVRQNKVGSSLSNAITSTPTSNSAKASKKKKLQGSEKQTGKQSGNTERNTGKAINADGMTMMTKEEKSEKRLEIKLYNKIEDNFHFANKKALLLNCRNYYEARGENVFDNLPVTFHIKNGTDDPEWHRFKAFYEQSEAELKARKAERLRKRQEKLNAAAEEDAISPQASPEKGPIEKTFEEGKKEKQIEEAKKPAAPSEPEYYKSSAPPKNIWILKPGENTNCGNGIQVAKDFSHIVEIVTESGRSSKRRTCIVQKYIHNPLLIHKRKFDIRTYSLVTSIGGNIKGYQYDEGYIRTSSYEFDINNLGDRNIHLTNDAIQKKCADYGKYEPGNKMSYNEFQHYLDKYHGDVSICFERDLQPQIDKLTTDVIRAVHGKLDPKRRVNTFEVFGLDFMIDDEFKLYLIEVNTNPCLELSAPLLARMIPNMLENAFKLAVDPMFPPPEGYSTKKAFLGDPCPENKFSLIFDDKIDGPEIEKLMNARDNVIVEMDEEDLSDEEELPDCEVECPE